MAMTKEEKIAAAQKVIYVKSSAIKKIEEMMRKRQVRFNSANEKNLASIAAATAKLDEKRLVIAVLEGTATPEQLHVLQVAAMERKIANLRKSLAATEASLSSMTTEKQEEVA